jgi:probable rRNA maturation factor
MPVLQLTIASSGRATPLPFLRRNLRAAHTMMRSSLKSLSIAIVGDIKMSRLHRQFMGITGPTDVLTFPLEFDAKHRCVEGEVVVCAPEAARRARAAGLSVRNELLLYCIHGMLHLNGMDDRTEAEFERMHRMEDAILKKLGIGPVFAAKGTR